MRYAISNNKRVEASKDITNAVCESCNNPVKPACGHFNIHHFRHVSKLDCDSWYEPITDWHVLWQNKFPEEYREFTMVDINTGITHRADIRLSDGVVIEIQNSPIELDEVAQRENFYGKHGLIWILNGENLIKHCGLSYRFRPKNYSLYLEIHTGPPFGWRHINHFFKQFVRSKLYKKIEEHPKFLSMDQQNGNAVEIRFSEAIIFENLITNIENEIDSILKIQYQGLNFEPSRKYFEVNYVCRDDFYDNVDLSKKYFRKFIDKMKCGVFIDNINGLSDELLYCYKSNSILKKSTFLKNPKEYAISK